MNQSEMILEFIDGTLDGGREQRLFDEMARHPELRAELRQYVMIGDAVRSDREAFSPPADVERRLLGGLGLLPVMEAGGATAGAALGTASAATGGAAATAGAASTFGWLALAKLKSALLPLVVGLVLGSAVGGGGVYLAMENTSGSDVRVASAVRGGAEKSDTRLPQVSDSGGGMSTAASSSPSLRSGSSANRIIAASPDQVVQPSTEAVARRRADGGEARSAPVNDRKLTLSRESRNNDAADGQEIVGGGNDGSPNPPSVPDASRAVNRSVEASTPQVNILLIDREHLIPEEPAMQHSSAALPAPVRADWGGESRRSTFALELRKGFVSQPFADNHAREVAGDFLREDLVAACFYSPSEDWYVGLEGGRERFAQSLFYNRGDTLFVEQRPALMWGGFALGRKVTAFDLPFFVQGTLGASQYGGPMARGRVGLDVAELFGRSSAFSLPLSFEASSLVYTYNGQYLVTGNWGISGGVQLHFGL